MITGGKGFLGRFVENKLKSLGYQNVFTASGVRDGLDLGEEANVGWLFDYTHPEYVIHLAANNSHVESEEVAKEIYQTNVQGTKNLLEVTQDIPYNKFKRIFLIT